jgi:hypothetical protein
LEPPIGSTASGMFAMRKMLLTALAVAWALPAPAYAQPVATEKLVAAPEKPGEQPAKPVKAKRHVARKKADKGYGFLPGYEPPERADLYGQQEWPYPRYWYRGDFRYGWGPPVFYRGRWNGGGFGPCWTQTPAGPVWNCGK